MKEAVKVLKHERQMPEVQHVLSVSSNHMRSWNPRKVIYCVRNSSPICTAVWSRPFYERLTFGGKY
jgi:hypothetical protein